MEGQSIKQQYEHAQEVVKVREAELRAAMSYLDQAQAEVNRLFALLPIQK